LEKLKPLIMIYLLITIYSATVAIKIYALDNIPIDVDEPTYLKASTDLGKCLLEGNITCLTSYEYNIEHPWLAKLLFGIAINIFNSTDPLIVGRYTSIFLTSIISILIAIVSPMAGLFYIGDPLSIKYGSEIYLDGIATLFTVSAFIVLDRGFSSEKILLSGVFAGASIASKYTSLFAVIAIPIYLLIKTFLDIEEKQGKWIIGLRFSRKYLSYLLLWITFLTLSFYILNPSIWTDPFKPLHDTRLYRSITYHHEYSMRTLAKNPYPPYQQLIWIIENIPIKWHPNAFLIGIGLWIVVLGYLGLPITVFRKPLIALWIIIYTLFLILWPIKWPQYTVLLTPALCISASTLVVSMATYLSRIIYYVVVSHSHLVRAVLIIVVIIVSSIPLSITEIHIARESCIGRGVYVVNGLVVVDDGYKYIVFNTSGMKPIEWRICRSGYNPVRTVKRGNAYNLPYEWIPSNNYPWPGEIYYSRFNVSISGRHICSRTLLSIDAPNILLTKNISLVEHRLDTLEIVYGLRNVGNDIVSINSDPSWAVNWGFSIELALSPPANISSVYQYYRLANGSSYIVRLNWVNIEVSNVSEIGIIDLENNYMFTIEIINSSQVTSLWLETGGAWITIRVHYRPIKLRPDEVIVYRTIWRLNKIDPEIREYIVLRYGFREKDWFLRVLTIRNIALLMTSLATLFTLIIVVLMVLENIYRR